MAHQHDRLRTIVQGVLDGWQGSNNTLVVSNGGAFEGDIEIHSENVNHDCWSQSLCLITLHSNTESTQEMTINV